MSSKHYILAVVSVALVIAIYVRWNNPTPEKV